MLKGQGTRPHLVYNGCAEEEETNPYIEEVLRQVPLLNQKYKPPSVWGKNGHIQTVIFSLLEKRPGVDLSSVPRTRHYVTLADGSRVSYDLFAPSSEVGDRCDVTIAVCPGLGNSSENAYSRAFAMLATSAGYRVVVLNALGVLDEKLTTPRIFTFGSTEEYGAMIADVLTYQSSTKFIALGFSLGANIVCKYLGENRLNQENFLCCISLCQGYDFNRMRDMIENSAGTRKFYAKRLTNTVRETIVKNWDDLKPRDGADSVDTACPKDKKNPPKDTHLKEVLKCKYMPALDELVSIRLTGHGSVREYYEWASSCHYLENIDLPTLFVNAKDDPLFPKALMKYAEQRAKSHRKSLFVMTAHGGHLGFYTKTGSSYIDATTWLERMVLEYINAVVNIASNGEGHFQSQAEDQIMKSQQTEDSLEHRRQQSDSVQEDLNANHKRRPTSHRDFYNIPHSWSTSLLQDLTTTEEPKPLKRTNTLCYFESSV